MAPDGYEAIELAGFHRSFWIKLATLIFPWSSLIEKLRSAAITAVCLIHQFFIKTFDDASTDDSPSEQLIPARFEQLGPQFGRVQSSMPPP
jgi:hypothetical protein